MHRDVLTKNIAVSRFPPLTIALTLHDTCSTLLFVSTKPDFPTISSRKINGTMNKND